MAGQELLSIAIGEPREGGHLLGAGGPLAAWTSGTRQARGGMGAHHGLRCWGCCGGRASSHQDLARMTVIFSPPEPLAKGLLRQTGACVWWGGKNYNSLRRG